MSGNRSVTYLGDAMAAVVQGVTEVGTLIGKPPVIVGGLAVLSRLSNPYRATTDLDIVDRLRSETSSTGCAASSRSWRFCVRRTAPWMDAKPGPRSVDEGRRSFQARLVSACEARRGCGRALG